MNKKITIIIVLLIVGAGAAFLLSPSSSKDQNTPTKDSGQKTAQAQEVDKVKVYYFHNTARCSSCKTLERYTEQTINRFFQSEVKNGKVEFKSINVDLPKNTELARKYGATGSSLFFNQIIDGQDNIQQNTRVWRLLRNKSQFQTYLSDKINSYLN